MRLPLGKELSLLEQKLFQPEIVSFQAQEIYEKAVEFFGEEYMDEKLFIAFAHFEEAQKVD